MRRRRVRIPSALVLTLPVDLVALALSTAWRGELATAAALITETDAINVGARYEHTHLSLYSDSPLLYQEFVREFARFPPQLSFADGADLFRALEGLRFGAMRPSS
jgi:hypothetical protein